mgnify:CR=1 FL=1
MSAVRIKRSAPPALTTSTTEPGECPGVWSTRRLTCPSVARAGTSGEVRGTGEGRGAGEGGGGGEEVGTGETGKHVIKGGSAGTRLSHSDDIPLVEWSQGCRLHPNLTCSEVDLGSRAGGVTRGWCAL